MDSRHRLIGDGMDRSGVGGGRERADRAHPSDPGSSSAAGRVLTPLAARAPGLASLAAAALMSAPNGSDACTTCGAGADQLNRERQSTNVGVWNPKERRLYQDAVTRFGANQWPAIARHVGTRDASQARTHGVRTRRVSFPI